MIRVIRMIGNMRESSPLTSAPRGARVAERSRATAIGLGAARYAPRALVARAALAALAALLLPGAPIAMAQCQYTVTQWAQWACEWDGNRSYTGTGLNDLGAWCGYRLMCWPEEGDGWLPVYCPPGGMPQVLPIPEGASEDGARATAVNNAGVVVGYMSVGSSSQYKVGVIWWPTGLVEVIPPSSGSNTSSAYDINDAGVIVGGTGVHPYVLEDGLMTLIDLSPFSSGYAWQVAASGVVTGRAGNENTTGRAFRWTAGALEFLEPAPGYTATSGLGINSQGWVVGFSRIVVGSQIDTYPTLWIDRAPIALPLLPGYSRGYANCVNDAGVIGGWLQSAGSGYPAQNVLWVNGEVYRTSDLLAPGSPSLGSVVDINHLGQLLGGGGPRLATPIGWSAADLNGDCAVNGDDLGVLLSSWGVPDFDPRCDFNGDGIVDGDDLGTLLGEWSLPR